MDGVQTWTVVGSLLGAVGAFGAVMFAVLGLMRSQLTTSINSFRAEFDSLRSEFKAEFALVRSELRSEFRGEMGALRSELSSEIGSVRSEVAGLRTDMGARFEATDAKIDELTRVTDVRLVSLEGDMHLVKAHLIGQRSA